MQKMKAQVTVQRGNPSLERLSLQQHFQALPQGVAALKVWLGWDGEGAWILVQTAHQQKPTSLEGWRTDSLEG